MVTASIIESLYVHCNGRFYDCMSSMQELFRAAMESTLPSWHIFPVHCGGQEHMPRPMKVPPFRQLIHSPETKRTCDKISPVITASLSAQLCILHMPRIFLVLLPQH